MKNEKEITSVIGRVYNCIQTLRRLAITFIYVFIF